MEIEGIFNDQRETQNILNELLDDSMMIKQKFKILRRSKHRRDNLHFKPNIFLLAVGYPERAI